MQRKLKQTIVCLSLFLILSACSSAPIRVCPKRADFTGTTWSELARYTGNLQRQYDSCSK